MVRFPRQGICLFVGPVARTAAECRGYFRMQDRRPACQRVAFKFLRRLIGKDCGRRPALRPQGLSQKTGSRRHPGTAGPDLTPQPLPADSKTRVRALP